MSWKALWRDNGGLTLVEILAALVILGIVFVGFMTVFPQMTKFNEKTYSKLETMNLAREELSSISDLPDKSECDEFVNSICKIKKPSSNTKYNVLEIYNFSPESNILNNNPPLSDQHNLHHVEIKILDVKKESLVSETFGYVKVDAMVKQNE